MKEIVKKKVRFRCEGCGVDFRSDEWEFTPSKEETVQFFFLKENILNTKPI